MKRKEASRRDFLAGLAEKHESGGGMTMREDQIPRWSKYKRQGRAQGQDRVPLPDARRRRNATRGQRVCRGHWRRGEGPRSQGVQRLVDQVERRRAVNLCQREDGGEVGMSHAEVQSLAKHKQYMV